MAENRRRTTLEQGRAAEAFKYAMAGKNCHENAKQLTINEKKEFYKDSQYKSYVKKIPMFIKTNGLGATFAFILSKQKKYDKKKNADAGTENNPKNAYDLIYNQIEDWLYNHWELSDFDKSKTLVQNVVNCDSSFYRAITIEVLALLNWMRRFAEGLIDSETQNN